MRFLAVLTLMLLSPFVGEFLLGNVPPDPALWLVMIPQVLLLYGGGAVLIREVSRRLGRGYPSMVMLALAFAVILEGILLGTMFNRDYLGLGLLEYGWVPQLGTSPVWSIYVLTIHVVWSILIPIVLAELLFKSQSREPWLRLPGTIVSAVVYALGALAVGVVTFLTYGFFPESAQLVAVAVLAALSIVGGLTLRPAGRSTRGKVPPPLVVAVIALAGGSTLLAHGDNLLWATYALLGIAIVGGGGTVLVLSRREAWRAAHTAAAAAGALGAYCWVGFYTQFSIYGFTLFGLITQVVAVLLALTLIAVTWRATVRLPDRETHRSTEVRPS